MNELIEFSLDTENAEKNYQLARFYEEQGHTAPANTYYHRASERTNNKFLAYECLLRSSFCWKTQGSRDNTQKVLLENALMVLPERPEAYYFLSLLYEKIGDWRNCYIYAHLGLECYKNNFDVLLLPEYQGKELLIFQKAVSSWHWGRGQESRDLFQLLADTYYDNMNEEHKKLIDENMNRFGLNKNQKILKDSNNYDNENIAPNKIFDCFRFFNEKELLELRYHILKDHVDKFVILQGNKTQSGNPCELLAEKYIKELNLPIEKFIIVNVELPSNEDEIDTREEDIIFRQLSGQSKDTYQNSLNARSRERILLDSLLTIVKDQRDNDVFLVSDCDEIIKPEYVNWFTDMALQCSDKLIKVPLVELQGKANLRAYSSETNQPVSTDNVFFIATKKHFDKCTPFRMRFDISNPFEVVYITQDGARVEECGWHFSWMGDTNRLKLKQKSTSHYADQIESAIITDMSSKELETYIDNWSPESRTNVWGDTRTILKYYPESNLPKQIIELDYLKKFFLLQNKQYNLAQKIINIVEKFDINGSSFIGKPDGTDKFTSHSYLEIYSKILSEYVDKENCSLLEIGCCHGGSLLLWSELLKNWSIVSLDVTDAISSRIKTILSTNNNTKTIFKNAYDIEVVNLLLVNYSNKFDIIIDDGPHTEESQLECLKLYFSLLKENGTLIIEDIKSISTTEKLKQILKTFSDVNYDVTIFDNRHINNVSDDIVFCVKKINNLNKKIDHIYYQPQFGENWFTYPNLYSSVVKKFPSESKFVEVGSWKGMSSAYMAVEIANSQKDIKFYCVDTWEENYNTFLDNMMPVRKYYKSIRARSLQAVKQFEDNSLDFIFIDASHEYQDVKEDIIAWLPKLKKGGILAGHDYYPEQNTCGVKKAVDEIFDTNLLEFKEDCWIYTTPKNILKKKIIDSFIFFNEFDMLKLRLNYLNDVVDHFIICESNYTFSGKPKPYYLDEILNELSDDIASKIIRVKFEPDISKFNFPDKVDNCDYENDIWKFEYQQRDYISKNLLNFSSDDIFMISDTDEIPCKEVINNLLSINLESNFKYTLKFDWFWHNFITKQYDACWPGTAVTTIKYAIEKGSNGIRYERDKYNIIENGGWHFSYFGDINFIQNKIKSFSHQEYNKEEYISDINILDAIKNRTDIFHRPIELIKYNFVDFPKNLQKIITTVFSSEYYIDNQTNPPIPVLGVPIVNGVHWLKRLIDSVDYPVKELFIVNNNGRDQITDELNEITKINHPFIEKIRVCHLPHNLGVSGSWNLIIKSYLMSPYWIICNNDLAFTPGFLKEMVEKSMNEDVEIVCPPSINYDYVQNGLGSFECFLLKDAVIQKCGLFDENLYPAYCEDCDYLVKIKANHIKVEFVYSPYYHGETQSYETGSQTLKSESSEISQKIYESHMKNIQYMYETWGTDWENWGSYSDKNITIQPKFYDINFNRQKYLGF